MIIKKSQTTLEAFSQGKIWDYPMPGEPVGISYQEYDVRVPEKGWGINSLCWEAYYVIAGSAEVYVDDTKYNVETGDVVVLKPNQKSYLVAKQLKVLTITQPNWNIEQYKEVETK